MESFLAQQATTSSPAAGPIGFWKGYNAPAGGFDEVLSPDGGIRDSARLISEKLQKLGMQEVIRRRDESSRLLRDSAVNLRMVHGSLPGTTQWDLDPLPFAISAQDWKSIEAGLRQRARLFNAILADLYGRQTLLRDGLLPGEAVLGNPGFLRPAHGLKGSDDIHLHLMNVDLIREPDGSWRVLRDITQTPRGMGIALENRLTLLKMFPEVYSDAHFRRLLPFFRQLRETLHRIAPHNQTNPRIGLLTPGSMDEGYFEHVYLARYLGFTLVEGSDLSVRDRTVYVKTLEGLLPIDVILRNISDSLCDPLELDYESTVGVPGLQQAAATGNVELANMLGAGLLDDSLFTPFLRRFCKKLLGEELKMDSVETYWCGEKHVREYVMENLEDMYISPVSSIAVRYPRWHPRIPDDLFRTDQEQPILEHPAHFIARRIAGVSTVPALLGENLASKMVVVRCFLAATPDGDYEVLPGAYARLADTVEDAVSHSPVTSVLAKDTWVIAEEPSTTPSLLQYQTATLPLVRTGADIPSRVAENLFWLGRYTERGESSIRLLRAVVSRLAGDVEHDEVPELRPLATLLQTLNIIPVNEEALETLPAEVTTALHSETGRNSLPSTVASIRRTAWMVRDRISLDAWRILDQLQILLAEQRIDESWNPADAIELLDEVLLPLMAFSGLATENMTRGPAWRFLDMGRRLERAMNGQSLLHAMQAPAPGAEFAILQALLEIADSVMTYRSRYLSSLRPEAVLDLLLVDETNPRSIGFQLRELAIHVEQLPRRLAQAERGEEERIVMSALTDVRVSRVQDLCETQPDGSRPELAELLERLERYLPGLSDVLTRRFFSHSENPRQLTEDWRWSSST